MRKVNFGKSVLARISECDNVNPAPQTWKWPHFLQQCVHQGTPESCGKKAQTNTLIPFLRCGVELCWHTLAVTSVALEYLSLSKAARCFELHFPMITHHASVVLRVLWGQLQVPWWCCRQPARSQDLWVLTAWATLKHWGGATIYILRVPVGFSSLRWWLKRTWRHSDGLHPHAYIFLRLHLPHGLQKKSYSAHETFIVNMCVNFTCRTNTQIKKDHLQFWCSCFLVVSFVCFSWGMQDFNCGLWVLVPDQG